MTLGLAPEVREYLERQQRAHDEEQRALYNLQPDENKKFFDLMHNAGFDPSIESVEFSDLRSAETVLPPAAYPMSLSGELLVPMDYLWQQMDVAYKEIILSGAGARERGTELTALARRPFNSYRAENRLKLYETICRLIQSPKPRPS